jgi:hypothetical protein
MLHLRALIVAMSALAIASAAGCNRKKPSPPNSGPNVEPPASVATDHFLIAQLRGADIFNGELFKEVRDRFAAPPNKEFSWEEIEQKLEEMGGFKLSQFDSATFCYPDFPAGAQDESRLVLIITYREAVAKDRTFARDRKGAPDADGFIPIGTKGGLLHFPDDKTIVLVHSDFKDRYRAGYARDRSKGWPLSEDFARAAESHTLFAAINPAKAPAEAKGADRGPLAALLAAKSLTLALDIKGRELLLGGRGVFADEAAAKKGQESLALVLNQAAGAVGKFADDQAKAGETGIPTAGITEAKRALSDAHVTANGVEVMLKASYNVNFNVGDVVVAGLVPSTQKVKASAQRVQSLNNLKMIGIGLHNYSDTYDNVLPISGVGKLGAPLRDPLTKPTLSWRVALLPFMDEDELYKQFHLDEPWDSEHNKMLIDKMPKIYMLPGASAPAGQTYYQEVIGPAVTRQGLTLPRIAALDGTSNTIAVVEAAQPVIWTKPDDVMIPEKEMPKDLRKKFGGHFQGSFQALLWDGSVRGISNKMSDKTLWNALRPDDGESLGDDW